MYKDDPYAMGGKPGPFSPMAPQATPTARGGMARYSAYGDMARGQMQRPQRATFSAYDAPQRSAPMGYGYGMPPRGAYGNPEQRRPMGRGFRDPGSPSNPFSRDGGY